MQKQNHVVSQEYSRARAWFPFRYPLYVPVLTCETEMYASCPQRWTTIRYYFPAFFFRLCLPLFPFDLSSTSFQVAVSLSPSPLHWQPHSLPLSVSIIPTYRLELNCELEYHLSASAPVRLPTEPHPWSRKYVYFLLSSQQIAQQCRDSSKLLMIRLRVEG